MYDTSPKQRVPSWCDRVLYTPKSATSLEHYASVPEALHGDHRPVAARFATMGGM